MLQLSHVTIALQEKPIIENLSLEIGRAQLMRLWVPMARAKVRLRLPLWVILCMMW